MTEASEEQVAALRERIRRAGAAGAVTTLAFLIALAAVVLADVSLAVLFGGAVSLWLVGLQLAALLGWHLRWRVSAASHRRQLYQSIASLPPAQQEQVIRPFIGDESLPTRELVKPWLDRLPLRPREPAPADAPTGRGDEPTP